MWRRLLVNTDVEVVGKQPWRRLLVTTDVQPGGCGLPDDPDQVPSGKAKPRSRLIRICL